MKKPVLGEQQPGTQGKWAQEQTEKWLSTKSGLCARFAWHGFPDARSARGALGAQPSDYLVVFEGTTFLEVKETSEQYRLPKASIGQYGKLNMFDMAGADVIVLVYRLFYDDWIYFHNADLFNHEVTPKSFPFAGHESFSSVSEALQDIFK